MNEWRSSKRFIDGIDKNTSSHPRLGSETVMLRHHISSCNNWIIFRNTKQFFNIRSNIKNIIVPLDEIVGRNPHPESRNEVTEQEIVINLFLISWENEISFLLMSSRNWVWSCNFSSSLNLLWKHFNLLLFIVHRRRYSSQTVTWFRREMAIMFHMFQR